MTENELESVAQKIVSKIEDSKRSFWVEPESHYQDHEFIGMWRSFWHTSVKVVGTAVILAALSGLFWLASFSKGVK